MSTIAPEAHVADLVIEQPGRARVFEQFGINYCCGGETPLATACAERGVDLVAVVAALETEGSERADEVDWTKRSVGELCSHIVEHHHGYLRDELPRLRHLVEHVVESHGAEHPELAEVQTVFAALADELEEHMVKEEEVVFPVCSALEEGHADDFPLGPVEGPIGVMLHEHDEVAAGLERLRELTSGYEPPNGVCNSYRAMLDRLQTLELDTHRHVHKENNILFPRAVALEAAA